MKRRILVLATVVLSLLLAIGISTFAASAEEAEPSVTIAKFNLAFEDNTYLKYAVRFDGVADSAITENNIGMLYWTDYADGFVPGTEDFSSKTTGYTDISGVKHYVFEYTHLAAKQLTDYVYSVAYIELDGTTYYSEPVKYSALEYAYNRLGKTSEGSTNTELKSLLNNMLAYGASAQQYFDYKEDRLATSNFYQITLVGGTLDDGFASGLYLATDKVTITAPEITEAGNSFVSWIDESGFVVSESREFTASDIKKNTVYSVLDSSMVAPSREGLEYTVNADGVSCTVTGLGTYSDTEVYIPEYIDDYKVTAIGEKAFADEATLTKIVLPETTKTIGTRAFYGCTGLTEFTVPASVTSIGTQIFYKAENLSTVYYNSTYGSESNPFLNLAHIKKVVFGGTMVPSYILSGCTNVSEVIILDSVTGIGKFALSGCSLITNIEIPDNVTSIGSSAFSGCSSLTNIEIPDGVTSIGWFMFNDCSALTSVVIPDSVTSIGFDAFFGCSSLTSVVIPDSVTSIGEGAFSGCSSLASIVIPDSVTSIGSYAFYGCTSFTSVVIPDSVTSIGNYTFNDCISLTSVVIPDSVTSIGYSAFDHCWSLKDVYYIGIEAEWTAISIDTSNEYLTNATRYYYSETAPTTEGNFWHYVDGVPTPWPEYVAPSHSIGLEFTSNGDGTCYVSGIGSCSDTTVYIPSISPDGDSVTRIGEGAFFECSSLTSIEIPDSVTSIGDIAFFGCNSLTSVVIGDSIINIGAGAFQYCSSLTSIAIPDSITSIGDWAFSECSSLTSIVIPDSVTSIGYGAFSGCSSLTSIVIPDSVTSIGEDAFLECGSLTSITVNKNNSKYKDIDGSLYTKDGKTLIRCAVKKSDNVFKIPDSVTSIGDWAFSECSSLTSIVIPDGVTSIGDRAFSECSSLTSVVIPDSIANIGAFAFQYCSSLTRINFGGTKAQWNAMAKYAMLYENTGDYTVYCKDGEIAKG